MSDWVKTIVIVLVYIGLTASVVISAGMHSLKDNWAMYRCNPMVMPFAGWIQSEMTTEENFNYCVQDTMASMAPSLTQPFEHLQSLSTGTLQNLNTSMENAQEEQSFMRVNFSGIITTLYDTFLNMIIQINIMFLKLNDTQSKLTGVITVILYVMTTVQFTFQSMWDGVPGQLIRSFDKIRR